MTVTWRTRSLEAFGDQALDEVAADHDLLVIDHPFCGLAATGGAIRPLDAVLDESVIAGIDRSAVGPSQRCYEYGGRTWALAVDAACQVSALGRGEPGTAHRRGEPGAAPTTWPEALARARALGRRCAIPLAPAHAISSLLTLWASDGLDPFRGGGFVDPDGAVAQIEWLIELQRHAHPSSIEWEPPQALTALAAGMIDYIPLTYGYVTYSHAGSDSPHGGGAPVSFHDIPGIRGSVLGGAGLAISARSAHPAEAATFGAWVAGADVQRELVAPAGGQPAAGACWRDEGVDAEAGGFYGATRATIENAWVRPRDPWWPAFQLAAGRALTTALEQRATARRIFDELASIHDTTALRSGATR